jgi:hypothetical protein
MGFGTDEESVSMRKFFEAGNAETIQVLEERFSTGKK